MKKEPPLTMSTLNKTWIFDLDGVLVIHNGYLMDEDKLIDGIENFLKNIHQSDFVIICTSRKIEYKSMIENFLGKNNINYNILICGVPMGERILINDRKPSGLKTAYAINTNRDECIETQITFNPLL